MHQLLILRKQSPVILFVLLYIAADLVFTSKEIYILNLIPFVLLLVYLALARIDLVYFLIVLLTPLSVQFIEFLPSSPLDFAIPTEPILFGVLILLIYRSVQHGLSFHQVLRHPVSYAIIFNLIWILVTSLTSTMPLVSFKFLLARFWFVAIYFWLAIMVFKRNPRYIFWFIWCYAIPMVLVIFYTIYRHLGFGLSDKEAAHFVMNPFFRDHTSYGAILAMLFFSLGGVVFIKKRGLLQQGILLGTWLLISAALILSYTRAAWISVLVALAVLGFTLFRIRFRYILIAGILAALYLTSQRTVIVQKMERNRQVSSATFSEHVQSISNITTDESNLERINRWNSALRMFRERPVFGWGPGTYMFKYAPFQVSAEKTGISTDFGNLGNAHSEYIGPLAESGFLGSLSFLLIGILTLMTGFRVYGKVKDKSLKWMVLGLILGYITYLVHGMLNNFLDTDKASALFWGFTAAFVSLDISLKELDPQN
jgi:putative inorganic carbon (hco3(-)) transporter